jgi:hypothetical protein
VATQAKSAYGTIVKIAGTAIPEVRNVSGVGFTGELADASSHDGAGWGVSVPTMKRGKPITLDLNWVPGNTQHAALLTAALAGTSTAFTVVYPLSGAPTWTFNAFVNDFSVPSVPVNGVLPLQVMLTPDQALSFA